MERSDEEVVTAAAPPGALSARGRGGLAPSRDRVLAAVVAALLLLAGLALVRAQHLLGALDARLGADVMVTPAGAQATLGGGPLLVDRPWQWGLPGNLPARIAATPGVAATVPLYNLGKLSAQECPA